MKSPIKIHGGKSYLAKKHIAPLIGSVKYTKYCEPFFGGGSTLFSLDPTDVSETINDLNYKLTTFWDVIKSESKFKKLYFILQCTPFSEIEFVSAAQNTNSELEQYLEITDLDIIEAWRFFVINRMSRQALGKDYATPTSRTRRGMNEHVSSWLTSIDGLEDIHSRLQRVEIRKMHCLDFIKKYDSPTTMFYCDPPYLHSTRVTKGEYGDYEMNEKEHESLLVLLSKISGKFVLSGYPSAMYNYWREQNKFQVKYISIDNKASSKKIKENKLECLWYNY